MTPGPAPTRRGVLASPLALCACGPAGARPAAPAPQPLPPLKALAAFPVGVEITLTEAADPPARALVERNFSQVTPGLEMKMEAILQEDGSLDFARADRFVRFAEDRRLRVHGHVLVWYEDRPPAFARLVGARSAFARAFEDYVGTVTGRFQGRLSGLDAVNEAVTDDGEGLRPCLWSEVLGEDYVAAAFRAAHAADPGVRLFLNDYNLESRPLKRRRFLRLAEDLLRSGAPLGGLGTQLHMDWTQDPKDLHVMMGELASLGLPIHVSELDVSTEAGRLSAMTPRAERLQREARLVAAAAEAFTALPAAQRYAFSVWGLRDQDSWLRLARGFGNPREAPTLFDEDGRPKPSARALAAVLRGGV